MKIVIFGLSISSAWGNGHATLWRGLCRALHTSGQRVEFFEKDVPYYAANRDFTSFPFAKLHLYSDWDHVADLARVSVSDADAVIVTSYCPDGRVASRLALDSGVERTIFYDMDTPVTLSQLAKGETVPYIPVDGLGDFNLVLSYTGGAALEELKTQLGAKRVAALYGWVDPEIYYRVTPCRKFAADLSYLGTYSRDRQAVVEELLIGPAVMRPDNQFVIAGAMYPDVKSWPRNIRHFEHVSPNEHREFYSSSPVTLNATRASMAAMGYCPSGRLFEAAACGTAVLSDWWIGLDSFFEPGREILVAESRDEAINALSLGSEELAPIGEHARERALACHTADIRAERLLHLIENLREDAGEDREAVVLSQQS